MSERTRGETLYLEGDTEFGKTTKGGIHFWIKVETATIVCDINPSEEGVNIHIYNTIGRYDKIIARLEEKKKLKNF